MRIALTECAAGAAVALMADIIRSFGQYICRNALQKPGYTRKLLLAGYRAFGLKLTLAPDRQLPYARRFSARQINRTVTRMLSHPEQAALVSVFMPCELLEAMDIVPMCAELYSAFLCGTWAESVFAEAAQEEGIAETFCSYHKILLGSAYTKVLPAPAMVANTSLLCDANNLTFRELAEYYHIPHYYVDVPKDQSEESVRYVADQFRELTAFLEDHTGKKLDPWRLRENMARSRETVDSLRSCMDYRGSRYLPGDVTSELYEIYLAHNALGTKGAAKYANMLLHDFQNAAPAKGLKLLWLHSIPQWQEPVRNLLNLSDRCHIAGCDMAFEGLVDIDPDHPYESMAKRLVRSHWNGGQERIDFAVETARALDADGVICFCHWGCKQAMGLSGVLKTSLEKQGFPTLILNGDGCDRRNASDGQTATRLDAFLEMLEKGKRHD